MISSLIKGVLVLKVSMWQALCPSAQVGESLVCEVPSLIGKSEVTIPLATVESEGRAQPSVAPFGSAAGSFQGEIEVYSVVPSVASKVPAYLQIQFELFQPARLLCTQSVRWKVPFEMPSWTCSAYDPVSKKRTGLTVEQVR